MGKINYSVSVRLPEAGIWRSAQFGAARLHQLGSPDTRVLSDLMACATLSDTAQEFTTILRRLSGRFAFILETERWLIAVVDRIRSVPLIWTLDDLGNVIVAQTADGLREVGALDGQTVDAGQALAVAMSGYTIGEDTLVSGVKALSAGQYLAVPIKGGALYQDYYRRYTPWAETLSDWSKSRDALRDLTLDILRDLVVVSKGRPIAIPLSAGFDSRLIAGGLKHLGHGDVLCFSYGLAGNREANAAREIAEMLGYRWTFFEYTNALARAWSTEADYDAFRRYSDSLTGIHFAQDFPAIRGLRDRGYLPQDTLIVNGQSGDFITGNHIPAMLADPNQTGAASAVLPLLTKHYALWRSLMTDTNRVTITALINAEISAIAGEASNTIAAGSLFEAYEFVNRQTKYVVNGQRCYEVLGFDWSLPLWDDRYIDFWEGRSLEQKVGQGLYMDMLYRADWGGVWGRIPINQLTVRPTWIRPLRLACKALHLPFGRAAWHRFEKRYFSYFMSTLCTYGPTGWIRVASDRRGPKSGTSLITEDYLQDLGVQFGDAVHLERTA